MKIWSQLHQDCAQVVCEQAASLPDYYPPVMRVVQVLSQPYVEEVRQSEGIVTVSGQTSLSLLYQTEDEKGMCCYRTSVGFSQSFSLPEGCVGECDAWVQGQSVTCRLTSARRVSFKAAMAVYVSVSGEKSLSGPESQEDMLYLIRPVEGLVGRGCACRRFHISERAESDCLPAAALCNTACAVVTDQSSAGGKTLIKGELTVNTLYVTKEDQVGRVTFTFPISQLLDIPSGEGIETDVVIRVGNIEVEIGENMDGSMGRFAYEIDLSVFACSTEVRRFELVCDAFSKMHALDVVREKVTLRTPCQRLQGNLESVIAIPIEPDLGDVIAADAGILTCQAKEENGRMRLEGECAVTLFHQEDNGRIHARELTLPFTATGPAVSSGNMQMQAQVWSVLPTETGVRLNLRYQATQWQEHNCEYLQSAQADIQRPLPPLHRSAVSVYFAQKGETLWDIAKKYRVSPQKIGADNKLDTDVITENMRLLIL